MADDEPHVLELQRAMAGMQVAVASMEERFQEQNRQLQEQLLKKMQEMLNGATKNKNPMDQSAGTSYTNIGDQLGSEGDSIKPRSLKLDFPRFDGEDPDGWCYKATQFFEYYAMPDNQKFNLAAFHMEGKALIWFQELRSTNNLNSWIEFTKAIRVRFGKGSYDDLMENLSKLHQSGMLEEYKSQFEVLANRVHDLPEHHKLRCFLGGLKPEIRFLVRMFNPKTLVEAYSLAKIQKENILNNNKGIRPWITNQFRSNAVGGSAEFTVGGNKGVGFVANKNQVQRSSQQFQPGSSFQKSSAGNSDRALVPVQKITQAQMDERRKKGLCYSCDSKWTRGHVCAAPKLFMIEEVEVVAEEDMVEEFEDCRIEDFPEISLNAITGTPNPRTMRLLGVLKGQQVVILIDSGSTHNFVDAQLAKMLGIQVQNGRTIKVKVANG
jgi:hypothetical protein